MHPRWCQRFSKRTEEAATTFGKKLTEGDASGIKSLPETHGGGR